MTCKTCKFWLYTEPFAKWVCRLEPNMRNINPETHVCDGYQPKNGDTIVELFGRRMKIVNDATKVTCNHCALVDICENIHFDYDTAPCEKANGEYNRHFEEEEE